jgi:CMP/dCMP kinase
MNTPIQIAIDGPVASGKGEIAARLAQKLGFVDIYTGGMYRALALACIQNGVSTRDHHGVIKLLHSIHIALGPTNEPGPLACRVLLDGVDVTYRVMEPDVASGSSDVGVIPEVRKRMVELQQAMAKTASVVMEGRDIGLRVLPNAQLKIYLTATIEERTKRRFLQWKAKNVEKTIDQTREEVKERDYQDMHRETDPLTKLPDAWELDTTAMTPEQVVETIVAELRKRAIL